MNLYPLIRPWLFSMDAETAHHFTLNSLKRTHDWGLSSLIRPSVINKTSNLCGIAIPNRVGLAAGLDKDGKYIDALADLGFGFIEIGTVTPLAQPGNPLPRMFRLPHAQALINRMGFNNDGVLACVDRVKQSRFYKNGGVIGLNIGKNAQTPIEEAVNDYLIGLRTVYPVASYITVNISSPNTKNLRALQSGDDLDHLLASLAKEKQILRKQYQKSCPLLLKIAPDLDDEQIDHISKLLIRYEIDGVIATNTTISREKVAGLKYSEETGGLSGQPVFEASNRVIRVLNQHLRQQIPIIGVGGILNGADAKAKINAGAHCVQVYTGLIYKGPQLIADCTLALSQA